jgi:hypothetical protein
MTGAGCVSERAVPGALQSGALGETRPTIVTGLPGLKQAQELHDLRAGYVERSP